MVGIRVHIERERVLSEGLRGRKIGDSIRGDGGLDLQKKRRVPRFCLNAHPTRVKQVFLAMP